MTSRSESSRPSALGRLCAPPRRARRLPLAGALLLAIGVAAALFSLPGSVDAKTTFDSAYTPEQTFNAALRLVRVDLGFKVTERDPAAGYLLFDYKNPESGERSSPGSIEIIANGRDPVVKVVIQLPQMPQYHEQVLMDELLRKLRSEYGEPIRPPASDRPPVRPDAGAPDQGD